MKILIVSYNKFPMNDAGAIREYNFGKIFKRLNFSAHFLGMGNTEYNQKCSTKDGIKYTSLRLKGKTLAIKIKNYFFHYKRLMKKLKEFEKLDKVLVIDIPIMSLLKLKKYCKKNSIELIHDSVEWYSASQFTLRFFAPSYIKKSLYNNYLIDKKIKVISISTFLNNHFLKKGIKSIRVPILFDVRELIESKEINKDKKLNLLYAGSPGKKDYLKEILYALTLLNESELKKVKMIILGVSLDEVKKIFIKDTVSMKKISKILEIRGRVPREKVIIELLKSDFTVLLRDPLKRYAKAGFPSKVVESLCHGVPIITNYSSDLNMYLKDNINSIIVKGCTSLDFYESLKKAMELKKMDLKKMKKNARKTGLENFDLEKYQGILKFFLESYDDE